MRKFIDKAIERGCAEAELFSMHTKNEGLYYVNNRLSTIQTKDSRGIALRVQHNGRLGFVGSSNIDDVGDVVDRAVTSAAYGDKASWTFCDNVADIDNSLPLYSGSLAQRSITEFIPRCEDFINTVQQSSGGLMIDCSFQKVLSTISIENTRGFSQTYEKTSLIFYTEIRLTHQGTSLEIEMQFDRHDDSIPEGEYARQIAEEIPHLLHISPLSEGKKTIIFAPDCVGDLFFALETGLRGSSVIKGLSPIKDRLGEQIFDPRITIIDDTTDVRGKVAAPFDDEGTPGQKTFLVREGVLQNFICDLKSANELNRAPTGNGLRSKGIYRVKNYTAKPICDYSNVSILPGSKPIEEMIAMVDDGILVNTIGGLLLANLTNGDYTGTIARGLKIEGGKVKGRVTNAMIAGNIYTDLRENLVEMSSHSHQVGAFSGQIGAFSVPYVMLKDITVSVR